jgi:hypothetical protein
MIVNFKVFHEKTDTDYIEYNKLWDEKKERFIFLQPHLSLLQQMSIIKNDMDNNKDILAIRFPSNNDIQHNKIINNMLFGKGIMYDNNKIWYPTEVWIYSPIH